MLEYFPDPHPDELLYSVWARYSERVRYPAKDAIFQELFGISAGNAVIDLPCHLGFFFDHLPTEHAYTMDDFINGHTLFPYYSSFLSKERREVLRTHMITGKGEMAHRLAGINCSIPRPIFLRYCPLCLEEDKKRFGESYWHRLHQVPGVEVCTIHEIFLENSYFPVVGLSRDCRRFIPAEAIFNPFPPKNARDSPYFHMLLNIAQDSAYLLKGSYICWENDMLVKRYASLLKPHRLLTKTGFVRKFDLFDAFTNYYNPELLTLLHCDLSKIHSVHQSWPIKVVTLYSTIHGNHPLRHILVIRFLNSTVKHFSHLQSQEVPKYLSIFGYGPWPCLNPVCEYYQQTHIPEYKITRYSELKRYKGPIAIFSCECGFSYTCSEQSINNSIKIERIISFGTAWEMKLQELWFNPTVSLSGISRQLNVSISILNRQAARLLLPVPRTSSHNHPTRTNWKTSLAQRESLTYRKRWSALMKETPNAGVTVLRQLDPQAYHWLCMHDKEWLTKQYNQRKARNTERISKQQAPHTQAECQVYRERWLVLMKETPNASVFALYQLDPRIYRWLNTHDKEWLVKQSQQQKADRTQRECLVYRERWLALMGETPNAGVTVLRQLDPQAYRWLNRHDKEWLLKQHKNTKLEQISRRQKKLSNYREQWLILMKGNPEIGISALRQLNPRIYDWLDEHDREWLLENRPALKFTQKSHIYKPLLPDKPISLTENNIDNDVTTANAIKNAFELLICQEPPKIVTQKSIMLQVPQVPRSKRNSGKNILTMKALDEAVETSEGFHIRRIKWATQKYREEGFCPTRTAFVNKLKLYRHLHLPAIQTALDEAMIAMSQSGTHIT